MRHLISIIAGLLFGLGLILSGMINPAKVQNFLDLFGNWDPSLAFVMGGAILVTLPGFWWVQKRATPIFGAKFQLPTRTDLDARLISGSAIFGIGWGLGGFCPGPAMTSFSIGSTGTFIFVASMLIGMIMAKYATNQSLIKLSA